MDNDSTRNNGPLSLAERAPQGLLLDKPALRIDEIAKLEHSYDVTAQRTFEAVLETAIQDGDLIEGEPVIKTWLSRQQEPPYQQSRRTITFKTAQRASYQTWRAQCPKSLLSELTRIKKWLGATPPAESIPPVETSLPKPPVSTARPASVANPEKRQRNDALNHAIRAALAVLSPSGGPLPRPPALFTYLAHNDTTKTVKGVAKGNRALLWVDDNNNEQSLTVSALRKRLDRIRQSD